MKKISQLVVLLMTILLWDTTQAQCSLTYSYSQLSNGVISVTVVPVPTQSIGSIVWNAGSQGAGVGSPFTVTYTANGTYSIALTYSAPCFVSTVAIVTVTNVGVCAPQIVTSPATSSSSCNGGATVTGVPGMCAGGITYTWLPNMSVGASVNGLCPGSYTVLASSANGTNCCATASAVVNIGSCSTTANFTSVTSGSNFTLTNTSSGATTYVWKVQTAPGSTVANTYTSTNASQLGNTAGVYHVTLTAIGALGCTSTKIDSVVISNPCSSTFSLVNNGYGSVSATALNSGTNTTVRIWNFGATTYSTVGNVNASHTFTSVGIYNVTLTTVGCGSSVQSITICPTPSFTSATTGNGAYTFGNASYPTNIGSTQAYQAVWSVSGSAGTTTTAILSKTFTANGSYVVTMSLVPTSSIGGFCNPVTSQTIVVTNVSTVTPCNVTAAFTYTVNSSNNTVVFTNNSTGTASTTTYQWYFGDASSSTVTSPAHQYSTSGNYVVSLYANNSTTCWDSVGTLISIPANTCNVQANFSHTVGSNGVVAFTDLSTGTTSNTSYFWYFGDGTTSNAASPTHTFASSGSYMMYLQVNNGNNCHDSINASINVTGIPCVANANFSLNPTGNPQNWAAIPAYPWNVSAASWSWGDNSTSNSLYTSHQYSVAGNYNICLTVTATCGSTATACSTYSIYKGTGGQIIYVNVQAPAYTTAITEINGIVSIRVYPNPSEGLVNLSIGQMAGVAMQSEVYNVTGSLVYSNTLVVGENGVGQMDLSHLAPGYYVIKTTVGGQVTTNKLLISK